MKSFLKAFFAVLAAAAAVFGLLLLLSDDKQGDNGYVTIYEDANEDENG